MPEEVVKKERPVLSGNRLLLRSPIESDKQDRLSYGRNAEFLSYGRNAEFRRMVGSDPQNPPPLTVEEVERWYHKILAGEFCWVIELEGRCIGTAQLRSVDKDDRRARYAIGIFDPGCWGKGYGTEATKLILRHAFEELRLHRVDLKVRTFNHRAIACYEKCGFVREGVEREASLIDGKWQSDLLMSILDHEYFKIRTNRKSHIL